MMALRSSSGLPDGELVLVTGGSGFIALHIIQLLQKEGFRVRATVRDLQNQKKVKPLRELCPNAKFQLEIVEADLMKDDGWKEAVNGCTYVMHVASPFPNTPPKNEDCIIVPAVKGTERVFKACLSSGSVKRIVLTSSIAAVHGETTNDEGQVYTEEQWSNVTSPYVDAYAKSKTLAEKFAWDFVKNLPNDKNIQLVVLNPSFVMGPSISGVVPTSLELIKRLLDGTMPVIPHLYIAFCDVRDVARAHLQAMILPEVANKRFIINAAHMWMIDIAKALKEVFGPQGYSISTWPAPFWALWIYSFIDQSTKLILARVNQSYTYGSDPMTNVLKIDPKKPLETLVDTVYGMVETGILKKTKRYVPCTELSKDADNNVHK